MDKAVVAATRKDGISTCSRHGATARVLLMGDSVSIAYSPTVRKELEGIANVHRVPANCGATKTAMGYYGLVRWINNGERWDVIVFDLPP